MFFYLAAMDGMSTGMNQSLNRSHSSYGNRRQVSKNYVYQDLLPVPDRLVNSGVAVLLSAHGARRSTKFRASGPWHRSPPSAPHRPRPRKPAFSLGITRLVSA